MFSDDRLVVLERSKIPLLLNRHVNKMKPCNQISKARAFWFQTKRFLKVFPIKVYIKQDGGHGSHLGFPIRMILAIFDL